MVWGLLAVAHSMLFLIMKIERPHKIIEYFIIITFTKSVGS